MNTKTVRQSLSCLALVFLLSSCATKPPLPADLGEPFVLERDLIGRTVATGGFSAIDGTIINNATVGIWGFRVATVNLIMERVE